MKKYFVLMCLVALSFTSKAQTPAYLQGYDNGFGIATSIMDYYVDMHPEYGMQGYGTIAYNVLSATTGQLGAGSSTTYTSGSLLTVTSTYGYSAYQAGQVVINHLWAPGGAIPWLEANSYLSDWDLGRYEGFLAGLSTWLFNHN
jgi:hypothetical protein